MKLALELNNHSLKLELSSKLELELGSTLVLALGSIVELELGSTLVQVQRSILELVQGSSLELVRNSLVVREQNLSQQRWKPTAMQHNRQLEIDSLKLSRSNFFVTSTQPLGRFRMHLLLLPWFEEGEAYIDLTNYVNTTGYHNWEDWQSCH